MTQDVAERAPRNRGLGRSVVVVSLMLVGAATTSACADLVVNGSFEDYAIPMGKWDLPGVVDFSITSGLPGWTIGAPIDYVGRNGWEHGDGIASLDLAANPGVGGISQALPTTSGRSYTVSFLLAGNPDATFGEPSIKTVDLRLNGATVGLFLFDTLGRSLDSMGWVRRRFTFTATTSLTSLGFRDGSPTTVWAGPAIDDVRVSCAGDLDADGTVGPTDLAALLGAWGSAACDLNNDGTTASDDLAVLLGAWGSCAG